VLHGQFAGLRYGPADDWRVRDLVQKLCGSYELELGPTIEEVIASKPSVVLDVGSAEGYYAVGLARRLPNATVVAYDIDPHQREALQRLAVLNGVEPRIHVRAEFPAHGWESSDGLVFALFDCEGAELELVNPVSNPGLAEAILVVELHEFRHRDVAEALMNRFSHSHTTQLITSRARSVEDHTEIAALTGLADHERNLLVDERRPEAMRWLFMRPRRHPER
jgi:hypothetical protein